jgi:hypothetical protein
MLNIATNGYQLSTTASVQAANSNEPPNFRNQASSGGPRGHNHLLIIDAWAMEIVGVGCGVLNAGYRTFGDYRTGWNRVV